MRPSLSRRTCFTAPNSGLAVGELFVDRLEDADADFVLAGDEEAATMVFEPRTAGVVNAEIGFALTISDRGSFRCC